MRAAVVTNGGGVPGLSSVVVKAASALERRGIRAVGISGGWGGLLRLSSGAALSEVYSPIDLSVGRMAARVGGSIVGSSRETLEDPRLRGAVAEACSRNGIGCLIVAGGDGTLTSAAGLHEHGLHVAAVPKTLDNDVSATPVSLGFATAVARAADMLDAADDTGRTHDRHMVVELMGRGSEALALGAAIAADVPSIIPEAPAGAAAIARRVKEYLCGAIAVAEGSFGWGEGSEGPEAGSAARTVTNMLEEAGSRSVRSIVPGHLLRGGAPHALDRWPGNTMGELAALIVAERRSAIIASDWSDVWEENIERAYERPRTLSEKEVARGSANIVL